MELKRVRFSFALPWCFSWNAGTSLTVWARDPVTDIQVLTLAPKVTKWCEESFGKKAWQFHSLKDKACIYFKSDADALAFRLMFFGEQPDTDGRVTSYGGPQFI